MINRLKKTQITVLIATWIFILILFIGCIRTLNDEYLFAYGCNWLLLGFIITYMFLKRNVVLFEPNILFSLYYLLVPITFLFMLLTNFEYSIFIKKGYTIPFDRLINISAFIFLGGYILTVVTYELFKLRKNIIIKSTYNLSNLTLNVAIVMCLVVGTIQFIYNIGEYGDIIFERGYVRLGEAVKAGGGSTFFYNFLDYGVYTYLYKIFKNNQKISFSFIILTVYAFIVKISNGRIYLTIGFILIVIGLVYFKQIENNACKNYLWILTLGALATTSIFIYFYRQPVDFTIENFFKCIVGRGNTPNIAILPEILDEFGKSHSFLYGRPLLSVLTSILPSAFRYNFYTANYIRFELYGDLDTGGLPATIQGDLYANFGYFGVVIGMFLLGAFMALLYNIFRKRGSFWFSVIYLQINIHFIFMISKWEMDFFPLTIFFYMFMYICFLKVLDVILQSIRLKNTKYQT